MDPVRLRTGSSATYGTNGQTVQSEVEYDGPVLLWPGTLKVQQVYRQDAATSTSQAWVAETVGSVKGDTFALSGFNE